MTVEIYEATGTTWSGKEGERITLTNSQVEEFNENAEEIYRKVFVGVITTDENEKLTVCFEL